MTTDELLKVLRDYNVILSVNGDRLKINAPQGVMTDALRLEIGRHRHELRKRLSAVMVWSITLDDLAAGKLTEMGYRVVRFDPDLDGTPWRPMLYVEPIGQGNEQA